MCKFAELCNVRLLPLRLGSRQRPRGRSIDVLYARDAGPGKRIGGQWIVALPHAREVAGSVLLCCGTLAFQLSG